MKSPCILVVLLAFGAGLAVGYFAWKGTGEEPDASPEAIEDAKAALDALAGSRKQGTSIAVREALDLVGRIVRGGKVMLDPLAEAIRTVPHHPYNLPVSLDHRAGVPSGYSNKKIALLEAVTRIGGDRAIDILTEVVEDRTERDWGTRVAAFAFLARHADGADREKVRDFYTGFVSTFLKKMRNDFVMTKILLISYGRLNPGIFTQMSGAYRTGWASAGVADAMSVSLHYLDREKAGALFMSTAVEEGAAVSASARKSAIRALARIQERRSGAAQYLLKKKDVDLLASFLGALLHQQLEYTDLFNTAKLSDDPEAFPRFCAGQTADLESMEALVREMEEAMGPETAQRVGVPGTLKALRERITNFRELEEKQDK